ncbi:MAG: CarD family transcriptional regulator [Acidobacteriota bacterium]
MSFKLGDKVIYPNQGVGVIQDVCQRIIAGRQEEFYMLRILSNNSTVMVPISNADLVGLRKICSEKQLSRLFEILENQSNEPDPDWKNRYKENVEKMKTGSIFEVAEVFKNLFFLNSQKSLSFREKKMFDRARHLVISEIATVQKLPVDAVELSVEEILASAFRRSQAPIA